MSGEKVVLERDEMPPDIAAECTALARALKSQLRPDVGMVLVLADLGDGGTMTFSSTVEREDAVRLLRELADALDQKADA